MKCQDCRTHLHPYLDSELEVKENLGILEHLSACSRCGEIFSLEERFWDRVRTCLREESAPARLRADVPRLLLRDDRRRFWGRATKIVLPLGAAAALVIFLAWNASVDTRLPTGPAAPAHGHGGAIAWAVGHFRGLDEEARKGTGKIVSRELLEHRSEHYVLYSHDEAGAVYQRIFEAEATVPRSLEGPDVAVAKGELTFKGSHVKNLILRLAENREVSVYVLPRKDADLHDLHLMEGITEGLKLERCRACDVVAVTEGDQVVLFVARPEDSVDALVALVRETL